jgi:hypothetical protein
MPEQLASLTIDALYDALLIYREDGVRQLE